MDFSGSDNGFFWLFLSLTKSKTYLLLPGIDLPLGSDHKSMKGTC